MTESSNYFFFKVYGNFQIDSELYKNRLSFVIL